MLGKRPNECAQRARRSRPTRSFFHSWGVFRLVVVAMTVQGRADSQEKFASVTEIVTVVAVGSVGAIIDGKLSAEAVAVRYVAHITERVCAYGKDAHVSGRRVGHQGIRVIEVVAVFVWLAPGENLIVCSFLPFVLQ